jgi:anti-anti-sigma factor
VDLDVPDLGWAGHLLLLPRSEEERRSRLSQWVRRGLEQDEKFVYTEAETELPERTVLRVLRDHGIDVEAAVAEGRLTGVPMAAFYAEGGTSHILDQALAEGYVALRMSAEARTALGAMPQAAYVEFERALVSLAQTRPVSALCQYDAPTTVGAWLTEVAWLHRHGVRETRLHGSQVDDRLTLAGEVDLANEQILAATLLAATSSTSADVFRVDLRAVMSLSAGGWRAIVEATRSYRNEGRLLLLVSPRPRVDRVIRLLGADRVPGLKVLEGPT